MTDYCENIVKIFVPEDMAHLVPQLVKGLAAPDADEGRESIWMSFERLLPRPKIYDSEDLDEELDAAISAQGGKCHHTVDWGDDPPKGTERIMARLRDVSEGHARAVDIVTERITRYGMPGSYEWHMTRWGTKWDAYPGDPPEVLPYDEIPGAHGFAGYDGTTMVSWRFTTANSAPMGYLEALARLCAGAGLGLRAWFSDNEGYSFNPLTNDVETQWTEIEDVALEIEDITSVRRLELAGGIDIVPDEMAERRVGERHPMFAMFE